MSAPHPEPQPYGNDCESGARKPHIYIVVSINDRKARIENFLNCLKQQTFRNFTTVVVDDGSGDGTAALIERKFPDVHVLDGDGNLWWTGATNFAIRHALAEAGADDAVLIINDDIEFGPEYLESLNRVWQARPNTLIGSVAVDINDPEYIVDGGRLINWWTAKLRLLHFGRRLGEFGKDYSVEVSLLTRWGCLLPVRVLSEVGLFDDKHFPQCGDTELPVRASNRGYRLIVSYAAVARIDSALTASINTAQSYLISDLMTYFFGIKSYTRLKYRFFFAYNTATNPLAFVSFLICDIARVTYHFFSRLRLGPRQHGSVTAF